MKRTPNCLTGADGCANCMDYQTCKEGKGEKENV